jgi:hypothetical protein
VLTDLYDCFNQCDVLIGDISGVVTEFLVSDKPYLVTNASGLTGDAFRQAYPTTRGAYLIGPDAAEIPPLLTALRRGDDPMADERLALRTYLLGDGPDRFQRAVDDAVTLASRRLGSRALSANPG